MRISYSFTARKNILNGFFMKLCSYWLKEFCQKAKILGVLQAIAVGIVACRVTSSVGHRSK